MKKHHFDGVSFLSGLTITLLGLIFLIPSAPSDIFDAVGRLGSWLWPLLFVTIGIGILIPLLMPSKEKSEELEESQA